MRSRTIPTLALVMLASPVAAQGVYRAHTYGVTDVGYARGYGYADEFMRGTYVGAPLTRFPRPSEIVPSPWSYGTYGVPTVSGIPAAPIAQPTLTVIGAREERRPARTAPRRKQAWAEDDRSAGLHVIQVQVPRR